MKTTVLSSIALLAAISYTAPAEAQKYAGRGSDNNYHGRGVGTAGSGRGGYRNFNAGNRPLQRSPGFNQNLHTNPYASHPDVNPYTHGDNPSWQSLKMQLDMSE